MTGRDKSIDTLRGFAIFIMIFANSAPYLIDAPHPFILRAIDSYAAPIFIALAGFGVSYLQDEIKPTHFNSKHLLRGILILIVASLKDIFTFGMLPFVGFDVLYLIGFSLILSSFFGKLNSNFLMISALIIVLFSIVFQTYLPYQEQIELISLEDATPFDLLTHFDAFLSFGWFPIFPWLAVFILGYLGGKTKPRFGRLKPILSIIFLIIFSASLFYIYHQNKITRYGYSELFYPADLPFVINMTSLLLILWINRTFFKANIFFLFKILGKSSLFIYILHSLFISNFLLTIFDLSNKNSFVTYFIFYLIIYLICYLLEYIKKSTPWKKYPYLIHFIFGK